MAKVTLNIGALCEKQKFLRDILISDHLNTINDNE